jgi:hypothetical protein
MSVTTPTRKTVPSSSSSLLLEEEETKGASAAEQTILGLSRSITSPDVFAKNSLLSSPLFPARNNNNGQGQPNNESFCGNATEEMMITDEHDQLLQQVSSWIHDLTVVREDLQRASVRIWNIAE